MEEEIEDLIGELKYTDSQNSNLYSCDFYSSSSSDQHNSSGKETYVIACDSDNSDSTYDIGRSSSAIDLYTAFPKPSHDAVVQCQTQHKEASTSHHTISLIEETYTQTSRTILELADTEKTSNTLETQTSFISIQSKVEYTIQYCGDTITRNDIIKEFDEIRRGNEISNDDDVESSSFYIKEIDEGDLKQECKITSSNDLIKIIDSNESIGQDLDDSPNPDSDYEEDSLMNYDLREKDSPKDCISDISEVPQSIDNEVEELYKKLSDTIEVQTSERFDDLLLKRCGNLTPLTEESTIKKDSLIDITPDITALGKPIEENCKVSQNKFENYGINVQISNDKQAVTVTKEKGFKLPPIQKQLSCPNSPHLNLLFTVNTSHPLSKAETLPCVFEEKSSRPPNKLDMWFEEKLQQAAGEHSTISSSHENNRKSPNLLQLPPIEGETRRSNSQNKSLRLSSASDADEISISDRIKELKVGVSGEINEIREGHASARPPRLQLTIINRSPTRSVSPDSSSSPTDAVERGCDSLCGELLRKLRSSNWLEVADTLDDVPRSLEKFWGVITEQRTADLIRQVSVYVESPRTQVARSACNTLGAVLKNTNYTKKPEFYEAVSMLLVKTGSFNRAVRRAANVALDEVVCGVELSRAVAALCVHGVSHKSALVRCAAARLLVVCTAIAGGGRELLRSRPASAAAARRQALQAMAAMLEDKSTDVRKFAERLYIMLRPLPNFEAFYLSDVDVELAARQMKRFDLMLNTR